MTPRTKLLYHFAGNVDDAQAVRDARPWRLSAQRRQYLYPRTRRGTAPTPTQPQAGARLRACCPCDTRTRRQPTATRTHAHNAHTHAHNERAQCARAGVDVFYPVYGSCAVQELNRINERVQPE